jgi:hypothetical protein
MEPTPVLGPSQVLTMLCSDTSKYGFCMYIVDLKYCLKGLSHQIFGFFYDARY